MMSFEVSAESWAYLVEFVGVGIGLGFGSMLTGHACGMFGRVLREWL